VRNTAALVILMKCDLCDNPAVVHETWIRKGVFYTLDLCERHARDAGLRDLFNRLKLRDLTNANIFVPVVDRRTQNEIGACFLEQPRCCCAWALSHRGG
jgi:hypothetical protein